MQELKSFGRAMNCQSFSTTPPSPLFRAAAGFSSHCIHVSHSGHDILYQKSRVLLENCCCHCTLNYTLLQHNDFVCLPITKYLWPLCPHFPMFPDISRCILSASQQYLRFTGGAEPCLPPEISGCRLPLPPPVPNLCELITNSVNHALLLPHHVVFQQLY